MIDLDDAILLDRWRENRDGEAFAELARRHTAVVFDVACRVVGERSLAEDVVQEALLDLALVRTRAPVDVGVVAWLVQYAVQRGRNRRASEHRRAVRQHVIARERSEETVPDATLERNDELDRALRGCNPQDRALLAMRFVHGFAYGKIAAALSIHEGAARVRVHRALEDVRSRLRASTAESTTTSVARALASLPLATPSQAFLDASIRAVVERAQRRLSPLNRERSDARSHRYAFVLGGIALSCVTAIGVPARPASAVPTPLPPSSSLVSTHVESQLISSVFLDPSEQPCERSSSVAGQGASPSFDPRCEPILSSR
ncbi:MAG: sigma-70 family RNA polymerase sigma factor [Planctomycetes bacterium]|nr:sigma-70 family RNA polymerase sigma factor [Planctomycetota bacterium]MCC7170005.1 sigma-70 family RNA polymerase sigma factor [Planctomycetota bacterium]